MSVPFADEVAAARVAQEPWGRLAIRDRLRPVRALRALIADRVDSLCAAVSADVGRPTVEVLATELLPAASALKFLEREAARVLLPRTIGWWLRPTWLMGCRDVIHRRPWGVVGVIGTWNYPIYLNVGPIAQALVAGNAVLWKPSENAPRTAELLHALFLEAGFLPDLFHKLPVTREAGPLVAEADVDHVVFTGSDSVGRKLAARLGERLVPSTLELSGCDVLFVLADANLELTAKAAWFGVTLNRGQTCIGVRRIFVQRTRYPAFVEELRKLAANATPVELMTGGQRLQACRLIEDALMRGARTLTPLTPHPPLPRGEGEPIMGPSLMNALTPQPPLPRGEGEPIIAPSPCGRGGWGVRAERTLAPTFLLDVPPDAAICREACFAPVAAIIPFDTVDEALAQSKLCPFGLGASIFTADVRAARELARCIASGSVVINDLLAPTAHPATPFGGRGASGWGVTQGAEGLLAMTVPQVVTVHRGTFRPHFDEAVNPAPSTSDLLRGLLRWTHGRGMREKFRGLWQLIRGVRKQGAVKTESRNQSG